MAPTLFTLALHVSACGEDPAPSGGELPWQNPDLLADAGGAPPVQLGDAGGEFPGPFGDAGSEPEDASVGADAGEANPLDKYGLEPLPISGEPIDTPDRTWTWIDFPDTKCRDGSPAGIAIRRNAASEDLMIFLEGGGACFDDVTCLANPSNADVWKSEQRGGILDPENPDNPLKDWNLVYVPYCTGDVHAGTHPDARVSDLFPKEQFVGYLNMEKYLQRVVPTFPDPKRLLLTGISAGGFGAATTAVLVQRAFPHEKMMLIDDSGPPQSSAVVPPCLQKKMRELWGFDQSVLKDCGAACPDPDNFFQDYGKYLVETFDDRPSGLIESVHDSIIAGFFGAGNDSCGGVAILTPVAPEVFEQGLMEFRDIAMDSANFGTYFPAGGQHTWLTDLFEVKFTEAEINGVRLTKWVADIVDGVGTSHVGP